MGVIKQGAWFTADLAADDVDAADQYAAG